MLAIFGLVWKVFGLEVAGWSLLPLVFSSLGTIWLSGRITGGHLLTLAWHAAAFLGLAICLKRPGAKAAALLGLWCGLGLYLDTMFLFTLVGLFATAACFAFLNLAGRGQGHEEPPPAPPPRGRGFEEGLPSPSSISHREGSQSHVPPLGGGTQGGSEFHQQGLLRTRAAFAIFSLALAIGIVPGLIGRWADPYDAYPDQFRPLWNREAIAHHAMILGLECLPRLIVGTEVSTLQADLAPWGRTLSDQLSGVLLHPSRGRGMVIFDVAGLILGTLLAALSLIWLLFDPRATADPLSRGIRFGLVVSSTAILAAFLVNRNIFNSDNYRYLIFLVVPWSLGFGLFLRSLAGSSRRSGIAAIVIAACFAIITTASTWSWYRAKRGYIDGLITPVVVQARPWNQPRVGSRDSLSNKGIPIEIPPEVTHLIGDYWDVYKIAFRSGGKVVGVPYPMYPNRLPGWSNGLGPEKGALMVLTPFPGWKDALATLWEREGRDPNELERLSYILPR